MVWSGRARRKIDRKSFCRSYANVESRRHCDARKATTSTPPVVNCDCKRNASWKPQVRKSRKFFAHQAKLALSQIMSDFEGEREGIWDEYDWERFLQQQDQRTEKYMELLEKYIDDPQRDEIIAREMGWAQALGDGDWSAEVDALLDEDWRVQNDEVATGDQKLGESFE